MTPNPNRQKSSQVEIDIISEQAQPVQMITQSKPWWLEMVQRQGLAVFIIVMLTFYFVTSLGPWIESTAGDMWKWHQQTVDKLVESSELQTTTNSSLVNNQKIFAEALEENIALHKRLTDESLPVLKRIDEGVNRLGEKLDRLHSSQ